MRFLHMTGMQIGQLVRRKEFAFTLTVVLLYCVGISVMNAVYYMGWDIHLISPPHEMFGGNERMENGLSFLLFYIIILFASVPFAMSATDDRIIRVVPLLQTRVTRRTYCLSKLTACFVGAFLVFFIPLCVNILLNFATFPWDGTKMQVNGSTYAPAMSIWQDGTKTYGEAGAYLFASLYGFSPVLYNFFSAAVISAFAGAASVFSCGFSWLIRQKKYLCILPLFVFYLSTSVFDSLKNFLIGASKLPREMAMAFSWQYYILGKSPLGERYSCPVWYFWVIFGVLIGVGVILTLAQSKRNYLD